MERYKIDPGKSNIPGWKIEPHFRSGVLMGNWNEEARNFTKGNYRHNTIYRTEYIPWGMVGPDVIVRRPPHKDSPGADGGPDSGARGQQKFGSATPTFTQTGQAQQPHDYHTVRPEEMVRRNAEMNNAGMTAEQLFHHHGNQHLSNMVTWYDEDYNGRWKEKNLPPLRTFHQNTKTWRPEKSDILVREPPTNFGLLAKMQNQWAVEIVDSNRGDYLTTYTQSYQPYVPLPRHTRYATPVFESTIIHPVNKTLNDLHLRDTQLLKVPEQMPAEMVYVSV